MKNGMKSILVVDDDPLVLYLLENALRYDGFRVLSAGDGIEALKQVSDWGAAVDMALIDIKMPRMNGKELARQLLTVCPGIKILFMSGFGPDIVADQPAAQRTSLLQKPFDFKRLITKVRQEIGVPEKITAD